MLGNLLTKINTDLKNKAFKRDLKSYELGS